MAESHPHTAGKTTPLEHQQICFFSAPENVTAKRSRRLWTLNTTTMILQAETNLTSSQERIRSKVFERIPLCFCNHFWIIPKRVNSIWNIQRSADFSAAHFDVKPPFVCCRNRFFNCWFLIFIQQ